MKIFKVALLLWISSGLSANAQFFKLGPDKTVPLVITHPPQFGLNVKRVAFGKPGGSCENEAGELVDRMILPDFQQNQMDVIERQALDQIMAEHQFNQSSYSDPTSVSQLGKILGPSAMIMVTVSGCRSEMHPLFKDQPTFVNNNVTRTYISKTRYTLEGSVRIVDLTTGKVLGSHNFESKPEKSAESTQGQPEYPAVDELKDSALEDVKSQIHSMFFPYDNSVNVQFYDDKECDLKRVYEQYKNGDHEGAMHSIDQGLQQCKSGSKEKTLARAYYDAGVLHCINKEYDAASDLFKYAMDSKGAEAVSMASQSCLQSKAAASQLRAYRDRLDQIPAPAAIVAQTASAGAPPLAKQPGTSFQPQPSVSGAGGLNSASGPPTMEDRLNKLESLYKRGLLTKREYDAKRAEILKDL